MMARRSETVGRARAGGAFACALALSLVASAAISLAAGRNEPSTDPAPLEIRLFQEPDFAGRLQTVELHAAQPYAYLERLGDDIYPGVRSLRAGGAVGAVLFRRAYFSGADTGCAPTLGSDASPDLIWTGATAKFLPERTDEAGGVTWTASKEQSPGGQGFASAILYRRDYGPPPGVLLLKRRRFYSRSCESILHSFNFDRRFIPLDAAPSAATAASNSSTLRGCVNLRGHELADPDNPNRDGPPDMRRSDRIVLLQPSDLEPRHADRDRRFRAMLFDAEDCRGESVTLEAPFGSKLEAADPAVRRREPRDTLLSSLLFRDRARSLRLELLQPGESKIALFVASDPPSDTGSGAQAGRKQGAGNGQAAALAPAQTAVSPTPVPTIAERPASGGAGTAMPAVLRGKEADPGSAPPQAVAVATASDTTAVDRWTAPKPRSSVNAVLEPSPLFATGGEQAVSGGATAAGAAVLAQSETPPEESSSSPGGEESGSQVFSFPVYDVYRLNYCLRTGGGCGEPAATQWCRLKGFDRAVAWQKDDNIGGLFPTFLIEDERICAQYNCDGFAEITCSR